MDTGFDELAAAASGALSDGRMKDAAALFEKIVALTPLQPDNWYNLGYARRGARDYEGALEAYGRALELGISDPQDAHVNRGVILKDNLDRVGEAEAELMAAIGLAPDFVPAWFNLGLLHEVSGRRDAARRAYRQAIAIDPLGARANARLAALDDDPERAVASLVGLLRRGRFPQDEASDIEFALANALDRAGRFAEAFMVVTRANERTAAMRRPEFRYDPAAHEQLVSNLIAAFPARKSRAGCAAECRPIFVCGMFRSGSTVTERWLSRHPAVVAGGELDLIPVFAREELQSNPGAAANLDAEEQSRLRGKYLAELDRISPDALHVTDKRSDNFLHLGLIKTLFPDALIVHTVRDPLDIAISTYFLDFAEPISYSTSLAHIGHYLAQYRRIMAHWQAVFGPDIVQVEYEELVRDHRGALDPVYRALSLEVEDADGPASEVIRTASNWSARSDLHARSVGRSGNYAQYLEPVRASLGL